jgi:arylsulfatase A-like enzyme
MRRPVLACLLALFAAAHAFAAEPTVILISFDGTRPSAVAELPVFRRIAAEGAWADRLIPAFPSNTFPNHATLVTGVSPDRHGIVNNTFVDPVRGRYDYDGDPTWFEVEPLWSLLARSGIPSASYFWVGSEGTWRNGLGPRSWKRFDTTVGERAKVDQILAWLDGPDPPRFVTSWFHGADGASHRFGPAAAVTAELLARQADDLAALLDGLAARHRLDGTTVLVVSDHGMAATSRSVDLAAALAEQNVAADVIGGGGFAQVTVRGEGGDRAARVEQVVAAARALGLEAWPRGATPDYATANPRFGDVVVVAPIGVEIAAREGLRWWLSLVGLEGYAMRGIHGHRPELPEMGALFGAIGRGVGAGARPGTVRAVDVAPTVLALLGQPIPDWMEGHAIPLDAPAPATGPR